MKAITLIQPYATLISLGMKKIETRSWATSYRGPLAIHAAKGPGDLGSFKAMRDLCGTQPFFDALMRIVPDFDTYCDRDAIFERLPLGAIVAVCEVVCCVPTEAAEDGFFGGPRSIETGFQRLWKLTDQERAFGDYSPGRFAWLLSDIRALPEPIPVKGALGLWEYEGAPPTEL